MRGFLTIERIFLVGSFLYSSDQGEEEIRDFLLITPVWAVRRWTMLLALGFGPKIFVEDPKLSIDWREELIIEFLWSLLALRLWELQFFLEFDFNL